MFQALRPLRPLRQVIFCHGQELIQVRAYATAPKTQSNAPLYLGLAGVVRLNQWGKADKKGRARGLRLPPAHRQTCRPSRERPLEVSLPRAR